MKKCKLIALVLSLILVLSILMQYNSSEDSIDTISKDEILKLRDSITKQNEESIKYRDSLEMEIVIISDSISSQLNKDSLRKIERINTYEKISNSNIDGVYVGIKLHLDSIEIPKQ